MWKVKRFTLLRKRKSENVYEKKDGPDEKQVRGGRNGSIESRVGM